MFPNETSYDKLSEKVGFSCGEPVPIPSVETAKKLYRLLKLANSIEAMEAVMRVVRFSPSAKTPEEVEAKRICSEASKLGRGIFGGDYGE